MPHHEEGHGEGRAEEDGEEGRQLVAVVDVEGKVLNGAGGRKITTLRVKNAQPENYFNI